MDAYEKTFWQSEPWMSYDNREDERSDYTTQYPVNITIKLQKRFLITGDITITFRASKPAEMVLQWHLTLTIL